MTEFDRAITPNEVVTPRTAWLITGGLVCAWLLSWSISRPDVFPSPLDVLNAFPKLWTEDGLGQELLSSLSVSLQALAISTGVALPLGYLSRTPLVRPVSLAVAELRFLSPAVFFLLLLFATGSAHQTKVALLVIGEATYLVASVTDIMAGIPAYQWDDARTLRMSEWTATWYVGVRGTLDQVIEAVRANAAMGWAAILFVEGIVRSEGGVGVLVADNEKHMAFANVWAVAASILVIGICQDYGFEYLKRTVCPWSGRV